MFFSLFENGKVYDVYENALVWKNSRDSWDVYDDIFTSAVDHMWLFRFVSIHINTIKMHGCRVLVVVVVLVVIVSVLKTFACKNESPNLDVQVSTWG